MAFKIGGTVKHSGYSLRSYYDNWLLAGNSSKKQRARELLDKKLSAQGTVVAIPKNGQLHVEIEGSLHKSLDYMFETLEV